VGHFVLPDLLEIVAAILFFLNYALSATAVGLCVVLYSLHRQTGWVVLAVAFMWPFGVLLLRVVQGLPLIPCRSMGTDHYGVAQLTYDWRFPTFYFMAVVALLLFIRDARRRKKTERLSDYNRRRS
jgi:hypothetical protein